METIINGLKQIKNRVDGGTITTVNGTETLLSKQLEGLLKAAINYTRCCESDSEQFFCDICNENGWITENKGDILEHRLCNCDKAK